MTNDPETPRPLETRLEELEIELAHQHEIIETLNQTVTGQWKEIDRLSKMLEQIIAHLRIQKPGADTDGNEPPPPHY